jgi:mannose-1-phosphate guanylyltransferase
MEEFPKLKEKLRMVIFCGGYGTRMWPMSRESFPKQFQPLLGEISFFRDTLNRVKLSFKPEDIYLSAPQGQVKFVESQAPEIPPKNIIAEPERRDTLGAIGYVTVFLDKLFPSSLMAVTWSDHFLREKERYARLFHLAARVCQIKNVICKIDVKPPYPATQLGWIKIGKVVGKLDGYSVYEFVKHVEKPKLEEAKKMFTKKQWLINTGYYVWRTSTMLGFYQKYAPECFAHLKKIQAAGGTKQEKIVAREYRQIEKTSVDYGLFEKLPSGSQLVIPADLGWHDVGTWDLLYEALARGQKENILKGEVELKDAQGNLVYLPKGKIGAIVGVQNLVVVDTEDGLLVCQRGRAGDVKKFVEDLKKKNKIEYL